MHKVILILDKFFWKYEGADQIDPPPRKKLSSKSPALLGFYFSYQYPIPDDLKSFLLCKLTFSSWISSYISETCCDFKTRIKEHIKKENQYHTFKHLHTIGKCFDSYNSLAFKIIDKANSKFDLQIKDILIGENLTETHSKII